MPTKAELRTHKKTSVNLNLKEHCSISVSSRKKAHTNGYTESISNITFGVQWVVTKINYSM